MFHISFSILIELLLLGFVGAVSIELFCYLLAKATQHKYSPLNFIGDIITGFMIWAFLVVVTMATTGIRYDFNPQKGNAGTLKPGKLEVGPLQKDGHNDIRREGQDLQREGQDNAQEFC